MIEVGGYCHQVKFDWSATDRSLSSTVTKMKLATFAAGCFWGVEEEFLSSGRVISTKVGYTGGHTDAPTYRQVCSGTTGHAEAVQVSYDPNTTNYKDLLGIFWRVHDPTTVNRQGLDIGSQYRSVIFYHDEAQKGEAEMDMADHQRQLKSKIVTQLLPATTFYPAEEYHQQYVRKNGGAACHI